jgi:hypothetical protein
VTAADAPPLAELLQTWQQWSHTRTLTQALATAEAAGNTTSVQVLTRSLAEQPDTDPLTALAANHDLVQLLTGWQWHAIRAAREHGATWTQIGTTLGLTADQTQTRYRHTIEQAERYAAQYTDTTAYRAALNDEPDPAGGPR